MYLKVVIEDRVEDAKFDKEKCIFQHVPQ